MHKTSEFWKENQKRNICSEGIVRIVQDKINQEVQSKATLQVSNVAGYCKPSSILDMPGEQVEKYITLEENLIVLDGTGYFPPSSTYNEETFGRTGYVSHSVSQSDGTYSSPIILEIRMSELITQPIHNFTIQWSTTFRESPQNAEIQFYNGSTAIRPPVVIKQRTLSTIVGLIDQPFDRIQIKITKWCLPGRRARIEGVWFGSVSEMKGDEIQEFSSEKQMFEDNRDLWVNEVRLKLRNTSLEVFEEDVWAPVHEWGFSLQDRIFIEVGFKDDYGNYEMIPLGSYYITNFKELDENTIDIIANDVLAILKQPYKKSTYNHQGLNVYDLVESLLIDSTLKNLNYNAPKYYISESFREKKVFAPLPFQSVRECLQLLAQETKAFLYVDRYGTIRFVDEGDALTNTLQGFEHGFTDDLFYERNFEEKQLPTKEIVLKIKKYTAEEQERTIYQSDVLVEGTKVFWFGYSSPSVLVSSDIVDGVLENVTYYTHGCEMRLTRETKGLVKVKIKGFPLIANVHEVRFFDESIDKGEIVNIDNYLKTSWEEGDEVYYITLLNRKKFSVPSMRINPAIDILDCFQTSDGNFRVNSIKFTFNGVFRGSLSGVVVE